jgi:hypothetical protein
MEEKNRPRKYFLFLVSIYEKKCSFHRLTELKKKSIQHQRSEDIPVIIIRITST